MPRYPKAWELGELSIRSSMQHVQHQQQEPIAIDEQSHENALDDGYNGIRNIKASFPQRLLF